MGRLQHPLESQPDWRAQTLAKVRAIIHAADPQIVEELKWRGTPVFSRGGIVCTAETYKSVVKMTFAKGAALPDPAGLFNSSLEGKVRRAIDIHEGGKINQAALQTLIRAAVALNLEGRPKLLSGGNPQIAKADGDAPVRAYIEALPGWKRDVGHRLDALILRAVPDVRKAVKWNSPFYGVPDLSQGWFLSFHTFTKYVKVTFFRGTSLRPVPPGASKHKEVRYLDISENDQLADAQLARWIRQAAALPGWVP